MTTYKLYLGSGPKRRTTMVHVPELLGCMANGPTTGAALDATLEAIGRYRHFLVRCGEEIDVGAPIETEIAEHITEGDWLGNGSAYVSYQPDDEPLSREQIEIPPGVGSCATISRPFQETENPGPPLLTGGVAQKLRCGSRHTEGNIRFSTHHRPKGET